MTLRFFIAAVAAAILFCCSMQVGQHYRHCREDYGFTRAFCLGVVLR